MKNLEQIDNIINNHIFINQSALVSALLGDEKAFFCFDDVINLTPIFHPSDKEGNCENCGEDTDSYDKITGYCSDCFDMNEDMKEVFEWYAISPFLASLLEKHGEVVLKNEYGTWWGRQTTGQSIALDSIIATIAQELS